MRIIAVIVAAALLGGCGGYQYGYTAVKETKVTRIDRDPMVGPVRATNARTMYERLEREMPLGGPK